MTFTFHEFFAGGGMARLGLGPQWTCTMANDNAPAKCRSYAANFGREHLICKDVAQLTTAQLLGRVDLAWASFPCQDLSEAGKRAGAGGWRSNVIWPCLELIQGLRTEGRAPPLIVLENVTGLLELRHDGFFGALIDTLDGMGYRTGAVVIDARLFLAQERKRVFLIAIDNAIAIPAELVATAPIAPFHTPALVAAFGRHAEHRLIWWRLPVPPRRNTVLADILEDEPSGPFPETGLWETTAEVDRLIGMMTPLNRAKLEDAKRASTTNRRRMVGGLYKRIRDKVQRVEIRFDDIAGCLRMPTGGSSIQTIMIVDGATVRARRLSAREAARLMGVGDNYQLPGNYREAYGLMADGLVAPAVRHLAEHLLEPILQAAAAALTMAAE